MKDDALSRFFIARGDTDFIVGEDSFDDLTINSSPEHEGFYFFVNSSKTLVKRFVLKRTKLTERVCIITLIKNKNDKFEPRFEFLVNDLSKRTVENLEVPVEAGETRLVKSRVNLDDCHEEFSQVLTFIRSCADIELPAEKYAVVTADEKRQLEEALQRTSKKDAVEAIASRYRLTEEDITVIAHRKAALNRFEKLVNDEGYFDGYRNWLKNHARSSRPEDVWQHFFEHNSWIFGYGLQLVACETLDNHKLETIVVGSDLFDGAGKRIDGLLKTKGSINRSIFSEIKLHSEPLLEKYERPGVYSPGKQLRGAVAQVQKTIHKVELKINENLTTLRDKQGSPTGEVVSFIKPKGLVAIGMLDQFAGPAGVNDEMLASFELYRQQIYGIDILTFDELLARTRFIVGD
jgi:hypothetical protein